VVDVNAAVPWVCPETGAELMAEGGWLIDGQRRVRVPIVRGVPRFVDSSGYVTNFGLEWMRHARTQLDSAAGLTLSADRFFESTGWSPAELRGRSVLEIGAGAGRFTEIVLGTRASLVSVDLSEAVDANFANNGGAPDFHLAQADLFRLPLRPASFDFVFCFGVLQHTPDPRRAFREIVRYVRPGGRLCVDVYPKDWKAYVQWRYVLRPITRRLPAESLYRLITRSVPRLMRVSTPLGRIPKIGRHLQRLVPVADYSTWLPVSATQLREWAVLDTFDWFSPAYDKPQTAGTLARWAREEPLEDVTIFRRGFLVLRARRSGARS
jgi:SAM-dependent methyltransferase